MRALTLAAFPMRKTRSLLRSSPPSPSFSSPSPPLFYHLAQLPLLSHGPRYREPGDDFFWIYSPNLRGFQTSIIWRFTLGLCWCLLHLFVALVHARSSLIHVLVCYSISSGLLGKYWNLDLSNLKYLGIVVDSEQAKNTVKIKRLLHWLSSIGVKNVILYDMEGVLKNSIGSDQSSSDSKHIYFEGMAIELLSFSDNKEGVAKAASFLCSKHLKSNPAVSDRVEPVFTEADMDDALMTVGCGGPEPDLLLVYGPARCHLGFPAWRMRYTEIMINPSPIEATVMWCHLMEAVLSKLIINSLGKNLDIWVH
ncbi:Ditranspolycis-polyprenyl diphosphate synthase ((2E6E)-farnesyl diphosphate specific) protein [Dioscorea alata]|uniref:Ditranspolycis-polyprenyl diphosphate synthase ((2E6E)-farnesyl diphosphate specific) protein n=1 Tax=Dioscorea alata TaxID=55571 RepID=A0ACB7WU33_DIOAL|nr:Ditranspolycis-polyprenyl diphosphate synthase ((2E6E)-farnesyl diphosphate specific) protein [Dioscorea alata]